MKQLYTTLLLFLLCQLIHAQNKAASNDDGCKYYYTVQMGSVAVNAKDQNITEANISSRQKVSNGFDTYYMDVYRIGVPSDNSNTGFYKCAKLKKITIPSTIKYYREASFEGCTLLPSIDLSHTDQTFIPIACCKDCSSLIDFKISDKVTEIREVAFQNCTSLSTFAFDSIKTIKEYAFQGTGLKTLTLPWISLGIGVFSNCKALTSVTTENSNISDETFSGCSALETFTAPNLYKIGNNAFDNCSSIKLFDFNNARYIGDNAFYGCTSLEWAHPYSALSIGKSAFENCTQMSFVILPKATNIGDEAFKGCEQLSSALIQAEANIGRKAFIGLTKLSRVSMHKVTTIGSDAFNGCEKIEEISLDSIKTIESNAFKGCTNLTTIKIGKNCKGIDETAFTGCKNISHVELYSIIGSPTFAADFSEGTTLFIMPDEAKYFGKENKATIYKMLSDGNSFNYYVKREKSTINSFTFVLSAKDKLQGVKVYHPLTGDEILPAEKSTSTQFVYNIEGLHPNNSYELKIKSPEGMSYSYPFRTDYVYLSLKDITPYMAAITAKVECKSSSNATPDATGVYYGNSINSTPADIVLNQQANAVDGQVNITGLQPKTYVRLQPFAVFGNDTITNSNGLVSYGLKPITYGHYTETHTQTKANIAVRIDDDGTLNVLDAECEGVKYKKIEKRKNDMIIYFEMKDLIPNHYYNFTPQIKLHPQYTIQKLFSVRTEGLNPRLLVLEETPTTVKITGTYTLGDATLASKRLTLDGTDVQGDTILVTGLAVGETPRVSFCVNSVEGSSEYANSVNMKHPAIELVTQQPKCVSPNCAIVSATTNISDIETNVGFQWRKYDAPESLTSNEALAVIYNNAIEGYIKNLQPTSYYKVRAFYKSNSGKYTYSDWVTFDPSDFSYFAPTIHTYEKVDVTSTTATVKGYALAGTEDIIEQGFKYWESLSDEISAISVPAKGQRMTAQLMNLKPNTEYALKAFAKTASGYVYGEQCIFKTKNDEAASITTVTTNDTNRTILDIYDLSGKKHNTLRKGINIIRYANGSISKVIK